MIRTPQSPCTSLLIRLCTSSAFGIAFCTRRSSRLVQGLCGIRLIRYQIKLSILSVLFVAGCGKNNSNSTAPSISVSQNKIYFVNSDYTSQTSYLYSMDVNSNSFAAEPLTILQNQGVIGFQSRDEQNNIKNLYITENIDSQPAVMSVLNASGTVAQNTTNFPQNISDILITNNNLYAIGYDKKEISVTSPDISSVTLTKSVVNSFSEKFSSIDNFSAILNQDNNFYVLTVGYTKGVTDGKAYLYQLSSDFISKPIANFLVQDNQGRICQDVSTTLRVSNNKVVIACNPAYAVDSQGQPIFPDYSYLFLVDVSGAQPAFKFLSQISNRDVSEVVLGGVSQDKNYVLITEDNFGSENYNNPVVKNSYWLNINNSSTSPAQGGAFFVTYNNVTHSYVFSCLLNTNSYCEQNTLGVASKTADGTIHGNVSSVTLNNVPNLNGVRGLSFFKEI